MNYKILQRILGGLLFLISLVVFIKTVQPSVSFWDPGEISAASYSLMVPHPPGGPLWLIIGRVFSMIPFGGDIGFRINMVSVFAAALTILLFYLTAIKVIESYRGKEYKNIFDALSTYLSAAVGALALSFADTFWFNAVESNYFAVSTLLFALVVWLMMVWYENYKEDGNEKYILLMSYLIGLSSGVHLMSVLALVAFVGVVVMKKYVVDEEMYKKTAYILLVHIGILLLVAIGLWAGQTSTTPPTTAEYHAFDSRFIWIMLGISVLFMAVFKKQIFNRSSFYMPLIIGGIVLVVVYPGIVKYFPALLLAISGDNITVGFFVLLVIIGGLTYLSFKFKKENKPIWNLIVLALLFNIIGFTSYAMIVIRANQHPPMDENNPKNLKALVSYLNREQYGDFPAFKRRFSQEPHQQGIYTEYKSDLDFLWRYQINHMFNRYLLWNFAGRESTYQDSGVNWKEFYAIPFLIGLLGIYFHFKNDWKMASIFLILFVFMGYLIAFYQNQQQPQPRERDYFYPGAYFVFALWISLGVKGVISVIEKNIASISLRRFTSIVAMVLAFLFIPISMLKANYYTHDRSKNWIPWDVSYNFLQSCAPNAILFTNGDNDTFPLWYLQYVEGVRRDVRIVNLSLGNTDWYILQLKHDKPYGYPPVDISMSDEAIKNIHLTRWKPQIISLKVPKNIAKQFSVTDSSVINSGQISFKMDNTLQFGDVKAVRVQDLLVKDIVESNNWKRPIYFASTCSEDTKIGLGDYLRMEGLAYRLVPQKGNGGDYVNAELTEKNLFNENPSYSKNYQPEFKFRSLKQANVFHDENELRLLQNYRSTFVKLALYYLNKNNKAECVRVLDRMEELLPRKKIDMDYRLLYDLGTIYQRAGDQQKFKQISDEVEPSALKALDDDPHDIQAYRLLEDLYLTRQDYPKAVDILRRLQLLYPDDPGLKAEIKRIQHMNKK